MGYPTLAVEANAFSPDPRYGSARPGIAQALRGDADPDDCVDEASDELPARVQAGVAAGDAHLGRVERLGGLLDAWSRRFEFVLVDAPPLLLAADAEIVLDRVGQALLVVEAGATTPGELARAARVLEAGGARAVGLVVNRVRVLEGGGYLRALLVEFLTRRKHADFASMPAWRLHVAARLGGRRLARPARTKGVPA
jgi:Mrp family chromosome partitioning ATPase